MDPLSITASVIAVLQLTTTLTAYLHDVRQATSDQKKLAVEACNLCSLLTNLRYRVEEASADDIWFNQVKLLGVDHGPLVQYKDILEKMVAQITTSGAGARLKSALTWRWTKSELNEALKQIERLKTLITIALTNDALYVSLGSVQLSLAVHCDNVNVTSKLSQAIYAEVTKLAVQTSELRFDVKQLKLDTSRDLQDRLSHWLQVSDPSFNFQAAYAKRHSRTGSWFLESSQFRHWGSSPSSLLWLYGNAGCGKTVLSATALQTLRVKASLQPSTVVCYFFFDFNNVEKQHSRGATRSLLFQLALQQPDSLQALQKLYRQCDSGQQQPSEDSIRSMLRVALSISDHTYLVLDALDECTDRENLLQWICDLVVSHEHQARILATSRRERDIEKQLKPIAGHVVNIQGTEVDNDIFVYVQDQLATDSKLKKWPIPVKDEIASELRKKANGMFQWAYCQLEALRKCIKLSALKKVLYSLPKTLDETYARIIRKIELNGHLSDAVIILRWLCISNRPLQLAEVVDILAVENGEGGGFIPEERLLDPEDIMEICSSLISCYHVQAAMRQEENFGHLVIGRSMPDDTYDESSRPLPASGRQGDIVEVRLAHFSVKEYFLSDRCCLRSEFALQKCHCLITESCLHYLLHVSESGSRSMDVTQQYPLIGYTAEQWWRHAKNMDSIVGARTIMLIWRLFVKKSSLLMWVQHYNVDRPWTGYDPSLTVHSLASPLYYAASIGLPEVVSILLERKEAFVNAQEGYHGTALQAASFRGHEKVVQILLEQGANVNIQGGKHGNALQAASSRGHETVVQILLEYGAIVNATGGLYYTALTAASDRGHSRVVQILLDWNADVNAREIYGETALCSASKSGHADVVRILLNRGAIVRVRPGRGSPLSVVPYRGHRKVVQLLLDHGVSANSDGGDTALRAAAREGHVEVVQLLLDYGVSANNGTAGNALWAAAREGHGEVVQLLLRSGANVDAAGASMLYVTSEVGYEKVVEALLDHGAEANIQRGIFGSALQVASIEGYGKIVKLLLDNGADVNIQGGVFGNALQAASFRGYEEIVQLLLDRGADVNGQGGRYGNALEAASLEGHEKVVQMLLNQGANVNAQGGRFNNALQAASLNRHKKVMQILLEKGADVNMVFKFGDINI